MSSKLTGLWTAVAVLSVMLTGCGDSPVEAEPEPEPEPEMEVDVRTQAFAGGDWQFRVEVENWDGSPGEFTITACPQVFGDCLDPLLVETTTFNPPTYTSQRYACAGFRGRVFGTAEVGGVVGQASGDCNP